MKGFLKSLKSTSKSITPGIQYVINPYTNTPIHEIPYDSLEEKMDRIEKSRKTLKQFKKVPIQDRIRLLEKVLKSLMKDKNKITEEVTQSTGKPITQSIKDFNNSLKHAREYIKLYEHISEDEALLRGSQPHGVSFITNSWRNPFNKCMQYLVPSFLSGNISVLSPSSTCPLIGSILEQNFNEEAFDGSVINLIMEAHDTFELVNSGVVDAFVFQGSHKAGKGVHLNLNLELDVAKRYDLDNHTIAIVDSILDEDNLDKAVDIVIDGAFRNSGQGSHSIKNVFIADDVYDAFRQKLIDSTLKLEVGNPLEESIDIGPICIKDHMVEGAHMIEDAVMHGAHLIMGGEPQADSDGFTKFFEPTLLEKVDSSMMIYFRSFTKLGLPIIILNRFSNPNYVKNFLLSPDAKKGGKRYLDQMLLLSDDDKSIDYMRDQFACSRIFYNTNIVSEVDKPQLMQFFNKEMRIVV